MMYAALISTMLSDRSLLMKNIPSSLHSTISPLPLNITETLMRKLLAHYQVDPTFLSVLFSFGGTPHLAETRSSNVANTELSDGSRSKKSDLLDAILSFY